MLGTVFTVLVNIQSKKKLFELSNVEFCLRKYFEDEVYAIMSNVVVVLIMALSVNEWATINETVQKFVTVIFALGGSIGAYGFSSILGGTKKKIRNIIDQKTDIADNINQEQ